MMRRAAQTLVLATTLILTAGLVLTAVVKVRDAAAKMQCQNHLIQIGLAINAYHDVHNHFPRAAMPSPAGLPFERRLSWLVAIFPYVEANNLSVRLQKEKAWDAEENRYLALTAIHCFQCPVQGDRPPVSTLFPTNYVGIAGLGPAALNLPAGSDRAGFFGYDRVLAQPALRGGSSSLLVILETGQVSGAWTGAGPPTTRSLEAEAPTYLGPGAAFGGTHRDGANALFADGSVRFLRSTNDPAVFRAAASVRASQAGDSFADE